MVAGNWLVWKAERANWDLSALDTREMVAEGANWDLSASWWRVTGWFGRLREQIGISQRQIRVKWWVREQIGISQHQIRAKW
ncbi:hypothetical protein A8990_13343 [Paenibacillus taihuensis]|uniref:Uncharacterized protein n=1 Tax=Paenibacillus taihuensis TaxID=1156355 RepID=A0A3D9R2G8_9BACL|nr:hypothetical protein A8990_13343 [Paenibacillus taihuensis]